MSSVQATKNNTTKGSTAETKAAKDNSQFSSLPKARGLEDFEPEHLEARRRWLESMATSSGEQPGLDLSALDQGDEVTSLWAGNIETPIGYAKVPLGIAGPLRVEGEHAQGDYYVPLATTEGALVASYQRGMKALRRSGGARVRVLSHEVHITSTVLADNIDQAVAVRRYCELEFSTLSNAAQQETRHGRLLRIEPIQLGRQILLRFVFSTADAMGLNMVNVATASALKVIQAEFPGARCYLRSNFSSDKKASATNLLHTYGRELVAECHLGAEAVVTLGATAQEIVEGWRVGAVSSARAGMCGLNAHAANALTALFIATGQDAAQVTNSSTCVTTAEVLDGGGLYFSVNLPSLLVATVGGGTSLPSAQACLELLDCYGSGKADRLAEIAAATVLAGELSIMAALVGEEFVAVHSQVRAVSKLKQGAA